MKHLNLNIFGQVQGVSFRIVAKTEADKLGITGFAKNMSDGSVYIEAEGEKDSLDKFVNWCHQGPTMAKVDNIEITEGKLKIFPQFTIS